MRNFKAIIGLVLLAGGVFSSSAADWNVRQEGESARHLRQADGVASDEFLIFGYCQGYATGLGQAGTLRAMIEIPAATCAEWGEATLEGVRIGFGEAKKSTVTIFIREDDMNSAPVYTQKVDLAVSNGWNQVMLDTPYKLKGQKFYLGYEFANCGSGEYPIGVDDVPTNNTLGDFIAVGNNWEHIGTMFGSICIQALINGDYLPKNCVSGLELYTPANVKPGEQFFAQAEVVNQGVKAVNSLDITCTVNGVKAEDIAWTIEPSIIPQGEHAIVTVSGIVCETVAAQNIVKVEIAGVNGVDNESADKVTPVAYVACYEEGYPKKMVVEEWTGTWCGWCVRGISAMRIMRETHPDDFIGLAIHYGDAMQISNYTQFINQWAISYPGCAINRTYKLDPSPDSLEEAYQLLKDDTSFATVKSLTADYDPSDADLIKVSADVELAAPLTEGDLSLVFVITEDEVGPYYQYNYYSGGAYGPMDGWENRASRVPLMFNEVVRSSSNVFGIPESLPANMEAGTVYNYTGTLQKGVMQHFSLSYLTAMILNGKTGEVVNGAQISLAQAGLDGVDAVEITIVAGNGSVEIGGNIASWEVYNMAGMKVAAGQQEGTVAPGKGIFMVKVTDVLGKTTAKKVVL